MGDFLFLLVSCVESLYYFFGYVYFIGYVKGAGIVEYYVVFSLYLALYIVLYRIGYNLYNFLSVLHGFYFHSLDIFLQLLLAVVDALVFLFCAFLRKECVVVVFALEFAYILSNDLLRSFTFARIVSSFLRISSLSFFANSYFSKSVSVFM